MIENFEDITRELNDQELKLVSLVIQGFEKHDESDPIKAPDIVKKFNEFMGGPVLSQPRLRKIVNYIRTNGLCPVMATPKGYFITRDRSMIESQIRSLKNRANGILDAANGLEKYLIKNMNK